MTVWLKAFGWRPPLAHGSAPPAAQVLLALELTEGVGAPKVIEPPRPAYAAISDSDSEADAHDDVADDDDEATETAPPPRRREKPPHRLVTTLLAHGFASGGSGSGGGAAKPAPASRHAMSGPKRIERAAELLRKSLALQPAVPMAAALLGIALAWASGVQVRSDATRYLQTCVEMLRDRMASTVAALTPSPPSAAVTPAAAAAPASATMAAAPVSDEIAAVADVAFERSDGAASGSCTREALLAAMLSAGQEAESESTPRGPRGGARSPWVPTAPSWREDSARA